MVPRSGVAPTPGARLSNFSVPPNDRVTFRVLYEDADLLVVNKPAKVATQPGLGHEHDALLNGLFARWGNQLQNLGAKRDFGLLHRLDRAASGLVVVGLRASAYDALREAFSSRRVKKLYWAVTRSAPNSPAGVIRKPIEEYKGRRGTRTMKLAKISSHGKPGITAYRTLAESPTAALVECRPVTGRLHQIRVHLDAIGCTILGDDIYGPEGVRSAAPRLALHAHRLVFLHPISGEVVDISSPWPNDLKSLLRKLTLPRPESIKPQGVSQFEDDAVADEEPGVGEA